MLIEILLQAASPIEPQPAPAINVSERHERKLQLGSSAMFRLAEAAMAKGESKTAEAIYSVMEQDSDSDVRAEARYRRARMYLASGRKRDAALLLRRVLDDRLNAQRARFELAGVLAKLGDEQSALRETTGATIAMIERGGRKILAPGRSTVLLPHDHVSLRLEYRGSEGE